jgi:AcrR family transcriptional regulator
MPASGTPPTPPVPSAPARQGRGSDTRMRLIKAGLEAFGRQGFEASSTREIAKAANANLAAIVYHFGNKEQLHLSVASYVVEQIQSRLGSSLVIADLMSRGPLDRPTARRLMHGLAAAYLETMLGEAEAEQWARFILREQMEPSAAFDTIYDFVTAAHGTATRLVACLLDLDAHSDEVAVRVFTLIGQILIFRVAQPIVLKKIGWQAVGPEQRAMILKVVRENVDRILDEPLQPEL